MELLPDVVLLAVFSYLDSGQLLRVRGVCRRWRDLALVPRLWEPREVCDMDPFLETVLRLAPCLRVLDLQSYRHYHHGEVLGALATRCAARELRLEVHNARSLRWASRVLDNQASRGRLRVLRLSSSLEDGEGRFQSLVSMPDRAGLETLDIVSSVSYSPPPGWVRDEPQPGTAHLKELLWTSCVLGDDSFPLLGALLEANSETLEVVEVSNPNAWSYGYVAQLSRCPRLRRLHVPLCEELAALDLGGLAHLQLNLPGMPGFSIEDAQEMIARLTPAFRRATQLELLTLVDSVCWMDVRPYWVTLSEVVRALGCAALRELRCQVFVPWGREERLRRTMQAVPLPRLPRLHALELPCLPPPELLAADSAPALRLLVVRKQLCSAESCALPRVRSLLAAHPRLHVKSEIPREPHGPCAESCAADCCGSTRHPQLGGRPASWFHSHPEGEPCGLHTQGGGPWLRLQ